MVFRDKVLVFLVGVGLGCLILTLGFPYLRREKTPHPWHGQTAPEGTYPLTFTDDYGRELTLEKQPRFVVSLAPSVTEMLFAMGMGDHVMGVTRWETFPPEAVRVREDPNRNVGNLDQPNREKILALQPHLVLGSEMTPQDVYAQLTRPGLVAGAFAHGSLADVHEDIRTLGRILGTPEKADALLARMAAQEAAVRTALEPVQGQRPPRVLISYGLEEGLAPSWSPGHGTWVHDLLVAAQAVNVAAPVGENWGPLSLEAVVAADPEILLLQDGRTEAERTSLREAVARLPEHPVWRHVTAVRTGRIHYLDPDLLAIPGPRMVWAYAALAQAIWQVEVPEAAEPLFATAPLHAPVEQGTEPVGTR